MVLKAIYSNIKMGYFQECNENLKVDDVFLHISYEWIANMMLKSESFVPFIQIYSDDDAIMSKNTSLRAFSHHAILRNDCIELLKFLIY